MREIIFLLFLILFFALVILLLPAGGFNLLNAFPPTKFLLEETGNLSSNNLLRSFDGGKTWIQAQYQSSDGKMNRAYIYDIIFDNFNKDKAYAVTSVGLYKTESNGYFWEKILDIEGNISPNFKAFDLTQSKFNKDKLYLAIYQKNRGYLLYSNDGISFKKGYITEQNNAALLSVALDLRNENIVYLGTSTGGFFVSFDGGKTYKLEFWLPKPIRKIYIDKFNPNKIYLILPEYGIFTTIKNGKKFSSPKMLKPSMKDNPIVEFIIDSNIKNKVYLALAKGVFTSNDGGINWKSLNLLIKEEKLPISAFTQNPKKSNELFVSASDMFYKSEDFGQTWSVQRLPIGGKLKQTFIRVNPHATNEMFIGLRK